MRIRRLFSSVLAGLALMYASGCSNNCSPYQQVAGYNVYGYPVTNTQGITYNAAYNPVYNAQYNPGIAPAPIAVQQTRRAEPQRVRVKRSKVRYARGRPQPQRFAQINPYAYSQPFDIPALNQAVMQPLAPVQAPIVATNFGPNYPGTATLLSDPNFVPTVTTNSQAVAGYTNYAPVNYQPVSYQPPPMVPAVAPAPVPAPVINLGPMTGSSIDCRTVYRRGRPIRQRYRKVRWIPIEAPIVQQLPAPITYAPPAPIVTYAPPAPIVEPYTPPPVVEPYVPPPVEPAPAPAPEPVVQPEPVVVKQIINPVIEPEIKPIIEPVIQPKIQPEITPIIEPVIRTRIEPTPVVEQPVQQPIVQPIVIQPIIQPIIQAPMQQQVAAEVIPAPIPEPVYQPQPVYMPPQPVFETAGTGYCAPDVCPTPNPILCQPGQNLSECFTLNEYQVQNSPAQIYTPTAGGPLAFTVDATGAVNLAPTQNAPDAGTASFLAPTPNYGAVATVAATPMEQMTTSKYEALPQVQQLQPQQTITLGAPQIVAPTAPASNIPLVPAASEIENALDAMLSRDQRSPNLK